MIVKSPFICGGSARIDNTRMPIWGIIKCIKDGQTIVDVVLDYPSIKVLDVYDACLYYVINREEIDKEIEENEKI